VVGWNDLLATHYCQKPFKSDACSNTENKKTRYPSNAPTPLGLPAPCYSRIEFDKWPKSWQNPQINGNADNR